MIPPHPEEEVQRVEVEEEPTRTILVLARTRRTWAILVQHVGVGPSSHPFLKGRYLNLWRLWRWWRARRLKSLGIVH
jgi:hypothetical protein